LTTPGEVLSLLQAMDCQVCVEGEKLRVQAPSQALTDDLRQAIREHKQALLALPAQPAPASDAAMALSPQEACAHQEYRTPSPPPYPGHPVGAPFRPGQQVWLYRWDDQTPRFAVPVTIVQMRTLWPGEQDIGWCDAAGELTWHHARLAVAVETQEA
jgi:tubulysin polyketide synthase-like protein